MTDSPTGRSPSKPRIQWTPPRTELGKALKSAFEKEFNVTAVPEVDYSELERRAAAQYHVHPKDVPPPSCPGCDTGLPKKKL